MSIHASLVPDEEPLLLGVDGGGTRSRARLADLSGATVAEAVGGPANIRFGLEESLATVFELGARCLDAAGLLPQDSQRIIACLALAGASEPAHCAAAARHPHPYRDAVVTTDAHAACVGAHRGRDGGIVIVGTGSIGWAELRGRHVRVGGWGLAVSDEGSGAWLGREALRRVLWAQDGRIQWTGLLTILFGRFQSDPHAIVRFSADARPRDFGEFAPLVVERAVAADPVALELMRAAGTHVDALARGLMAHGTRRVALMGGLARAIEPWLAEGTRRHLVAPQGDAVDGALLIAAAAAGLTPADMQLRTLEKHR
jgi:glucosamine kinase